MSISFAEATDVTCPECGNDFSFAVWLIVAAEERPDLVERIRAGLLHILTCPQCNHALGAIDAPLLTYRPENDPPILFSPAQQTTSEQNQQQAMGLVRLLRERLGDAWREEWLAQGLPGVQRAMLPVVLADEPEALVQFEAQVWQTGLSQILDIFLHAHSWNESYRVVQAHPELLGAAALARFDQAIVAAEAQGNSNAVAFFTERRDLLHRCGEIGVDAAFAENLGVTVEQLVEAAQSQHTDLDASPTLQPILAEIAQLNHIPGMPRRIKRCRQALTLVSQKEHPRIWAKLHVDLANSLAQSALGERAENLEQAISAYEQALRVQTRTAMPVLWAQTTSNLALTYTERIYGERAKNVEQAIALHEDALDVLTRDAMPMEWAMNITNLAMAYSERINGDRAENLEQAIALYQDALKVLTRSTIPVQWAQIMNNLASVYQRRLVGDREENLERAIVLYEETLEVRTQGKMPTEWAQTIHNLAMTFEERLRGERAENIERAITLYRQALTAWKREVMPLQWAATSMNLATVYTNRIQGEQMENLEQAIALYEDVLTVATLKALSMKWTDTLLALATAYQRRARGDRAENLEHTITLYEHVLTPQTMAARPLQWAESTLALANAYQKRTQGPRAENLERAIELYRQVLIVWPRALMPAVWIQATVNLATAYAERILNDRAENLEQAIALYEQVVTVQMREANPVAWAHASNHLATVYAERIQGVRRENLERAIALYEQVLTVRTYEALPMEWAETVVNMANAYQLRIQGERRENLDQAVTLYEQALMVPMREVVPVKWATAKMNLATAHTERINGSRAENLDKAIELFAEALEVLTREEQPQVWAQTANNLAATYIDRIRGDRVENLEQAITWYEETLTVRTRNTFPAAWAETTMNLALVYIRRIRGKRAENYERAIALCENALTVRTRTAMPIEWAQTATNLAGIYANRVHGDRAENLERAITLYEAALEVQTRAALPTEWAQTITNLAGIYAKLIRGDRAENLERAIALYKEALELRTQTALPIAWAKTKRNLANIYRSRIHGDRVENLEQAIAAYQQTLTVFRPDLLPEESRQTAHSLGDIHADLGHWKAATAAYDLALQAAEALYLASDSQFSKAAEIEANRDLYRRAAYALGQTGQRYRAVEIVEQGRARGLGETLNRDRADLVSLQQTNAAQVERYLEAAAALRQFEISERSNLDPRIDDQLEMERAAQFVALTSQARSARAELDAAVAAIREIPGYAGFLRPPTYAEIAATARPGAPLVYLLTTPQGSLALIVPHGDTEPEALQLEGFTEGDLDDLLVIRKGNEVVGGYLAAQLLARGQLDAELGRVLPLIGERLIGPLAARLRGAATGVILIPTGLLSLLPLHAAIYAVDGETFCLLDEFDVAYAPSARVLASAQREARLRVAGTLRVTGVGNPLPSPEIGVWALAELQRGLPAIRQQVQMLLPRLEITALQSNTTERDQLEELARRWREALTRLEELSQQAPAQLVNAGGTLALAAALFAALPDDVVAPLANIAARIPPSLTYARSELVSILELLPPGAGVALYEQQATRDALWSNLSVATIAHLACHGQFGLDDTLDSSLLLAQDSRLTLRELVTGDTSALANLRLVVLSACQTAITDFRRVPDETIGLPGGFLRAGVPAVVGSLWSVNDLSTALLMHRFYELHLHGNADADIEPQPPVRALGLAQRWLRDVTYQELFDYLERHAELKRQRRTAAGIRIPGALLDEGLVRAEQGMFESPSGQPFAHPSAWAAFAYYGALEVNNGR